MFNFILEKLGEGLRSLSLLGGASNVCAIIIYSVICLLPVVTFLILTIKKKLIWCDAMLLLLSAVLFYSIYYLINPALFIKETFIDIEFAKELICGLVYGTLVVYLILRVVYMYNKSRDLYSFFKVIFLAFIVAFVLCLIEDVRAFIENIEAFMDMGKISKMAAVIRFGADTSIEIVNIVIIICAYGLVKAFKKDGFSKKVIEEAERLKRFSVGGLTVIVLLEFVCNIIQVFARSAIDSVRMIFTFPIANILIIFIIILITKYISVTKEIKEENEMFI